MLGWRPPRRLRQIAAVAGRGIHTPPGGASLFLLCVSCPDESSGAEKWTLAYRSEAVEGTSHPSWAPLPPPERLSLPGSSPTHVAVALAVVEPQELAVRPELRHPEAFSNSSGKAVALAAAATPVGSHASNGTQTTPSVDTLSKASIPSKDALEKMVPGVKVRVIYEIRFDGLYWLGSDLAAAPGAADLGPDSLVFDFMDGELGAWPWPAAAAAEVAAAAAENASAAAAAAFEAPTGSVTQSPMESPRKSAEGGCDEKSTREGEAKEEEGSSDGSPSGPSPDLTAAPTAPEPTTLREKIVSKLRGSTANLPGSAAASAAPSPPPEPAAGAISVAGARFMTVPDLRQQIDTLASLQASIRRLTARRDAARDRAAAALAAQAPARAQHAQLHACAVIAAEMRRRADVVARRAEEAAAAATAAHRSATVSSQALASTLQALQAANRRIIDGEASLNGEEGMGRLAAALRELVGRRCLMAAQLGWALRLGPAAMRVVLPPPGGLLDEQLEAQWAGTGPESPSAAALSPTAAAAAAAALGVDKASGAVVGQEMRLAICGMGLDSAVWRHAFDPGGFEWDPAADRAAGVALGWAALLVDRLASVLGVPLRYPIVFRGSTSAVVDNLPPAGTWTPGSGATATPPAAATAAGFLFGRAAADASGKSENGPQAVSPVEYPLYCASNRDRPRFAVGVFLLNKDAIQLLQAHGISAAGPSHLLQNLHKLVAAAQSGLPPGMGAALW